MLLSSALRGPRLWSHPEITPWSFPCDSDTLTASWLLKELTPIMPWEAVLAREGIWLWLRGTLYRASAMSAALFRMISWNTRRQKFHQCFHAVSWNCDYILVFSHLSVVKVCWRQLWAYAPDCCEAFHTGLQQDQPPFSVTPPTEEMQGEKVLSPTPTIFDEL